MQVQLKNNVFTATQWFKDGDHPAVGKWIVEMFDGIHLYSDEEFREEFIIMKKLITVEIECDGVHCSLGCKFMRIECPDDAEKYHSCYLFPLDPIKFNWENTDKLLRVERCIASE